MLSIQPTLRVCQIVLKICLLLIPAAESLARLPSPTLLFHAGSAQILSKNIERRGISKEDWDRFIMPLKEGQTNFNLKPYRQGLYGAQTIADVGLYSYYKMQNGIEPQIMAIQLKAVCTEPPHRFGANYQIKPVDPTSSGLLHLEQNLDRFRVFTDLIYQKTNQNTTLTQSEYNEVWMKLGFSWNLGNK